VLSLPTQRYALFPLFLGVLFFIILSPVFWTGSELPRGKPIARAHENADLYDRVFPALQYGFGRLRAGELPLWNPGQLCGAPFQPDPQTALFQPINAVFLFLDPGRAMAAQAFLCLCLMGSAFLLFARALGMKYTSGVFGGVAFAFCGTAAAAMSRPELAAGLAWTPLFFWTIRDYARAPRQGMAVLGGIALALILLSGSAPLAAGVLMMAIPYALLRVVLGAEEGMPPLSRGLMLAGYLAMAGIGGALAAVQWLPAVAWLVNLDSPQAALWRLDLAGEAAARLADLPRQLVLAEPGILPRLAYAGVAALLMLPAAWFHRYGRAEARFFSIAALLCFVAASLGERFPESALPFEALYLPGSFCLAITAALGLDRLTTPGRDPRAPHIWAPICLMLLIVAFLLYAGSNAVRGRALLSACILLPFFIFRLRWIGAACAIALSSLLFVDLYISSMNHYQHPVIDPPLAGMPPGLLKQTEETALNGRVLISAHPLNISIPANLGMMSPIRVAGGARIPLSPDQARWWAHLGAHGASPDAPVLAQDAARPSLLNYMAVRALLAASDGPLSPDRWRPEGLRLRSANAMEKAGLYINDSALPRVMWTPVWRIAVDLDEAVALISDPAFDPRRECVITKGDWDPAQLEATVPRPDDDAALPDAPAAALQITSDSPERIVIECNAPRPGIVLLADSYAPGWSATLNAAPAPILQTNGLFRGVAVPEGAHRIEFHYRPLPFWMGLSISLATLAILILGGLLGLIRRG
jgi:hypothetical protein